MPPRTKPLVRKEPDTARLTIRAKKCKACRKPFVPSSAWQTHCRSEACALAAVDEAMGKRLKTQRRETQQERKADRAKRESLLTRSDWVKKAQAAFNAFVRARDAGKPCISCGTHGGADALTGGYWDCGHFRSTGAAPHLRLVEANAHRQCKRCNWQLAGNAVAYRVGLIQRIGLAAVEQLEADQEPRRHSIAELQELAKHYRAEVRRLEREAPAPQPSPDSGAYLGACIL